MKNIFVTGSTSGLGLAVCKALLEKGFRVFAIGRNDHQLFELYKSYSEEQLIYKSFDLCQINAIELLINDYCEKYGKLDGMVLSAGKEETLPLSLYKPEKVRAIFDINVFANIEILRIFSKKKISNDESSVVFLSSVMAELGQPGKVGYCATKSALLGIIKAASLELVKRKIRVNAVAPAVIKTPLTEKLFSELTEEAINVIKSMHPSGLGEVGDVVPLILFLLSPETRWITGQNIKIDGGYSLS